MSSIFFMVYKSEKIYLFVSIVAIVVTIFLYFILEFSPSDKSESSEYVSIVYTKRQKSVLLNKYIYNQFDCLGLMGVFENFFPNSLFVDSFQKTNWIDGVNAIYLAYKEHFSKIILQYDLLKKEYDVIFVLAKNNRQFHFANGAMLPDEIFKTKIAYVPYYYSYPTSDSIMIFDFPIMFSDCVFNMNRNYDFFYDLYGKNRQEINANLKFIKFDRFSFPINTGTECYQQTVDVFKHFEQIRNSTQDLSRWFNSIKSITSFSPRLIANTGRPSTHTFSISMDILTTDQRPNYWYWTSKLTKQWWNIPDDKKSYVPKEIVEIFEKHGFCWGGKWQRYDIMHFEYKPENLYKKIR